MKITIEVPDVMPANFARPSLALLGFIREFQELCMRLNAQYRTVGNRSLFNAFIRNGVDTVFSVEGGAVRRILFIDETPSTLAPAEIDRGSDEEEEGEPLPDSEDPLVDDSVYMDIDRPGNWTVARLCIDGWDRAAFAGFVTLHSSDFESQSGQPPKAQCLLANIGVHLATHAHRVPGST